METKCKHKKRKSRCFLCGGRALCAHKKRQESCIECEGNQICYHGRQRSICIECGGGAICVCNRQRATCRKCSPLSWAKSVLSFAKYIARKRGYAPPNISPKDFVRLRKRVKRCAACNGLLSLDLGKPHLHHNHETGEIFGFCHQMCNQAEGMLSKLTLRQRRAFFLNFFPEILN